jgi:thymidylate kinase
MKKTMLVSISGLDGSGKTTLVNSLSQDFKEKKIIVNTFWGKLNSLLIQKLILLKNRKMKNKTFNNNFNRTRIVKTKILELTPVYHLYVIFFLLLYFFQLSSDLYKYQQNSDLIILDRYIDDMFVDLAYDGNRNLKIIEFYLQKFNRIFPNPDIKIFLDVKPKISLIRKNDIPNKEFIYQKYKLYKEIVKPENYEIINAHESPDQILKIVKLNIESHPKYQILTQS